MMQHIPRQIFQIGIHPTPSIKIWRELNPEYSVNFLNDTDCGTLLTQYNDTNTTRAYTAARVGVIRADLCRLLVLILRGGFYVDTDVVPTGSLRSVVPADATMFSTERYSFEFMGSIPNHPFIRHALETSTQNIIREIHDCSYAQKCCRGSHQCVIMITGPPSYFTSIVRISKSYGCTNKNWAPGRDQCAHVNQSVIRNIYKCRDSGLRNNPYKTTLCGIARHMDCRNSGSTNKCHGRHYSKHKSFYVSI